MGRVSQTSAPRVNLAPASVLKRLAAVDPSSASLQRDVIVGLDNLGNVLAAQGDLAEARTRYEEGLDIAKHLAAADPSSALLQQDFSVRLLFKLGDVLVAHGDLAGANTRYQGGLDIVKRLAAADPNSASLQRKVWVSMARLANRPGTMVSWQQVADVMQDMQRRGVLEPADFPFLDACANEPSPHQSHD